MHANWDSQQPDINLQGILNPSSAKLFWNYLFGQTGLMGKATVVVALILGYFIIANILGIQTPISGGETATILPTPGEFTPVQPTSPTPSLPATWIDSITIIDSTSQACLTVPVVVYENDTLENIAKQYGITTKTLLEYNKDKIGSISGTLPSGMELNITLCDNTPARTATTINNAITVAPVNGTIFPTQPQ